MKNKKDIEQIFQEKLGDFEANPPQESWDFISEKINEKVQEMEKDGYQIKTMSFWGADKAVLIFKKGLKGSLL